MNSTHSTVQNIGQYGYLQARRDKIVLEKCKDFLQVINSLTIRSRAQKAAIAPPIECPVTIMSRSP